MGHSNVWNSHPKSYGPASRTCRVCGNLHGLICKYGLMYCRQCFRSNAMKIGFIKGFSVRWIDLGIEEFRQDIQVGATPKGVFRVMSLAGLTIYHVKRHLQFHFFSDIYFLGIALQP